MKLYTVNWWTDISYSFSWLLPPPKQNKNLKKKENQIKIIKFSCLEAYGWSLAIMHISTVPSYLATLFILSWDWTMNCCVRGKLLNQFLFVNRRENSRNPVVTAVDTLNTSNTLYQVDASCGMVVAEVQWTCIKNVSCTSKIAAGNFVYRWSFETFIIIRA